MSESSVQVDRFSKRCRLLSDLPRRGFRNPVKNAEPLEVMLPSIRNVQ